MLFEISLICAGAVVGIIGTLVFQGGETSGRLAQHGRNLWEACCEAREYKAVADALQAKIAVLTDEFETRYANMALAYDREVLKNHTVEARRVQAWKALDSAVRELHADPDPKCITCGDSIQVDDRCFVCGLHDWSTDDQPVAQA